MIVRVPNPISRGQGCDQDRDQVHDLDHRVDGRPGGVLERIADRIADDRGLVAVSSFAAESAKLTGASQSSIEGERPRTRPVGRIVRRRSLTLYLTLHI